jgi:hypothetical protein
VQTKLVWIRVPRPNKASKRYGRPTFAKAAVCRSWEKHWGSVKLPKAFGSGKVLRCHQPATITGIRVGCKRKASTAAERRAHKKSPRFWEGHRWEGHPHGLSRIHRLREGRRNPTATHCHVQQKSCRALLPDPLDGHVLEPHHDRITPPAARTPTVATHDAEEPGFYPSGSLKAGDDARTPS